MLPISLLTPLWDLLFSAKLLRCLERATVLFCLAVGLFVPGGVVLTVQGGGRPGGLLQNVCLKNSLVNEK